MRAARPLLGRRGQIAAALLLLPLAGTPTALAQDCDPLQLQKLLASRGTQYDCFGQLVALSDQFCAVGILRNAVFVFGWNGFEFVEQSRLTSPDGGFFDNFGCSIDFADEAVVIGAREHDEFGLDSGIVYTFKRDPGGQWLLVDELTPLDHAADQHFGASVATSGADLIVGAPIDANASGSAYIFSRQGDHWTQVTKLLPDGEPVQREFGNSVDICGDLAIVGAFIDNVQGDYSGSSYIFRRDHAGQWRQEARLLAPDGRTNDLFGAAVAISGNLAFSLAPNHANPNQTNGAIYVHRWNGRYWFVEDEITLPHANMSSLAVLGDVLLIGSTRDDAFGYGAGSAYVFRRAGDGAWNQVRRFFPDDAHENLAFGSAVALCGNQALIGAIGESYYGEASGAAYMFDLNCAIGSPQLLAEPTCPNGGPIRIEWTGATPRVTVNLLFARQYGETLIPTGWPCSGVTLGLGVEGIRLAWRGSAGADGNRTIVGDTVGGACGGYLQLLDSGTCLTSNVVRLE